jgi:hypothetical protein
VWRRAGPAFWLLVVLLPVYMLRIDEVAGTIVDDGWYVMLARALAAGHGYRLVNAPGGELVTPMYPPGFPALLSLVFHAQPSFPDNVWLLKSVSIAAMLGVALLSYVYLHRHRQVPRQVAALAAAAVALTPSFVFLAASTVMSECVFTLAQLAAVVLGHRAAEASPARASRMTVAGALAGAAAVLIRSAGIAVVAAVFLYLLKARLWRRAALFAAVMAVCLAPWLMYSRIHAPTPEQQEMHRGSILYSYGQQFWMRWAGSVSTGRATTAELGERVAANVFDVAARGMGGIFAPALLRGADESGEELLSIGRTVGWTFVGMGNLPVNMAISCVFAAIVFAGYMRTARLATPAELLVPISLLITVLWPWWTFRFVLPLAPFLFLYLVRGLSPAADYRVARIVLMTIAALNLYDHGGYVLQARESRASIDWLNRFDEADATLRWMNGHLDKDAVVATTNPPLVHLYTGQPTITLDTLTEKWSVWRGRGARYIAPLVPRQLPTTSRGPYKVVYERSPGTASHLWVLDIE